MRFPENLELGSGPKSKSGWLTVDTCKGADVFWDLRLRLPFPDFTFTTVYCSHVLEHFSYTDLRKLLSEINRVLKPGGSFLIAVPDASLYVDIYNGKLDSTPFLKYEPAVVSREPMDILNYIFYMGGEHKFMFDKQNLRSHCESAGFERGALREFDPDLDLEFRRYESLYFKCEKRTI